MQATICKASPPFSPSEDCQEDLQMEATIERRLHVPHFKEGKTKPYLILSKVTDGACRKPVSSACLVMPVTLCPSHQQEQHGCSSTKWTLEGTADKLQSAVHDANKTGIVKGACHT